MTIMETKALRILDQSPESSFPPGLMILWAGGAVGLEAPKGWLLCDGSAVPRDLYPALFSAVGVSYGQGNGSTTFNLPGAAGAYARMASTIPINASGALTSTSAEYSGHQHTVVNSLTINTGGTGLHSTNGLSASTDAVFAGSHAVNNTGVSNVGGGQTWNVGSSNRQSRNVHSHPGNAGANSNHNSDAHNVSVALGGANHTHTAPTIPSANQTTVSTLSNSWTPRYIDVWHIIKT